MTVCPVGDDIHDVEDEGWTEGADSLVTRGLVAGSGALLAHQLGPDHER